MLIHLMILFKILQTISPIWDHNNQRLRTLIVNKYIFASSHLNSDYQCQMSHVNHSIFSTKLLNIESLLIISVVATTISRLNILPKRRKAATSPYVTPPMKYTSTTGLADEVHGFTLSGMRVSPGSILSPFAMFFQPLLRTCSTNLTETGAYPP
jgi:hypothetical protein